MGTAYGIAAWVTLVILIWYGRRRWRELGAPAMRPLTFRDVVHYFWLMVLWPWPVVVIGGAIYFQQVGNNERAQRLNIAFDSLSQIRSRIAAAEFQTVFDPRATPANTDFHPPGWWLASDGNWYSPEQHPDYRNAPPANET